MSRWFRFYTGVVDDPKAQMLAPDLFKHWVNVLCIAAENEGELPALSAVAFKLRLAEPKAAGVLAKLCSFGLLDKTEKGFRPHNWDGRQYKSDKADNTNADRQKRFRDRHRNAGSNAESNGVTPVTSKQPDTETETDNSETIVSGAVAPPDPSIAERELFERGRQVLGKSAGGQIAKLKTAKGGNVALARSVIEAASTKQNPAEYVAAAIRAGPPSAKPLTEFQRKQQETNDVRQMLRNSAAAARSGGTPDRVLSIDHGGGPASVRGGTGGDLLDLSASPSGQGR